MGYKGKATKANKEKKKERPVVVRSHTGCKFAGNVCFVDTSQYYNPGGVITEEQILMKGSTASVLEGKKGKKGA
tara:strand:+ start:158 stop:379 length:222 start_codon:yes stop_codon:yes gene_type:complete